MITVLVFLILAGLPLYWNIRAHRDGRVMATSDAVRWTIVYIASAAIFGTYLWIVRGRDDAMLFASAYLLEKALSVDNLLAFGLVFAYLQTPARDEHRVLYYGVFGAVALRLLFVAMGLGSLWMFGRLAELVFGVVVAGTAIKVLRGSDAAPTDHGRRWYARLAKWISPRSGDFFLCVVAIECTDIVFSFDSVPTVISMTRDPVLVYPAMVFAILGLRSMYFVLASLQRYLVYLNTVVAAAMLFVAAKLVLHAVCNETLAASLSLAIVVGILMAGVVASLVRPRRGPTHADNVRTTEKA